MKQNTMTQNDAPIMDAQGGSQTYLTAEELIRCVEPQIRAMFR